MEITQIYAEAGFGREFADFRRKYHGVAQYMDITCKVKNCQIFILQLKDTI